LTAISLLPQNFKNRAQRSKPLVLERW